MKDLTIPDTFVKNNFSFGNRLRCLRRLRGITQKDLGLACGFSENAADMRIRQYESGKRHPKQDVLQKIAKKLDVCEIFMSLKTQNIEDLIKLLYYWLKPVTLDFLNDPDIKMDLKNIQKRAKR